MNLDCYFRNGNLLFSMMKDIPYQEIHKKAAQTANALKNAGVKKGDQSCYLYG